MSFTSIIDSVGKIGSFEIVHRIVVFTMIFIFVGIVASLLLFASFIDSEFHKYIIIVTVIILCILLLYLGQKIKTKSEIINIINNPSCPDYWFIDDSSSSSSGTGHKCRNTTGRNIGNITPSSDIIADFTETTYQGSDGNCAKYKWAKTNGIYWDGISNGNVDNC